MSKKNKDNNQFDISRKLKKLVEDLLSIAEEHHKNSKKGLKFFEKIEKHPKKKPSQKEFKPFFELLKKNKNANHAFLIYSFSLFEQFLSGLLKHLIKTDEEIKFLNHREKADPSSSFKDNLRFYRAVGKSDLLQSVIFSERYGSYESTSSFVLKNLHN